MGERDIGGDDDRTSPCPLGNPIIRGVRSAIDDYALYERLSGNLHEAVADHIDFQPKSPGDTVDLLLYRTCIRIYIYFNLISGFGQRALLSDGLGDVSKHKQGSMSWQSLFQYTEYTIQGLG